MQSNFFLFSYENMVVGVGHVYDINKLLIQKVKESAGLGLLIGKHHPEHQNN